MNHDHEETGGGSPHTSPEEGHPAGDGERDDRDHEAEYRQDLHPDRH